MFGLKQSTDRAYISEAACKMQPPRFEPRAGVRIDANEAEAAARNDASVGECETPNRLMDSVAMKIAYYMSTSRMRFHY